MARWLFLCACVFGIALLGYREVTRASDAQALGGACESTHDCRVGMRCIELSGVIEGQCSTSCNADSSCAEAFGGSALCLGADLCARACQITADCPSSTQCNAYGWCERHAAQ